LKPVLVLQHLSGDGPAFLATWLRRRGIRFEVRDTEAGEAFPRSLAGFGALAILGGEMSANDDLPSLRQAEALWLEALREGVPTLGHCLGGQLMARALGVPVTASPMPEIGWQSMQAADTPVAKAWFGRAGGHTVFQWHHEAFGCPSGAQPLAMSAACPVQAFAIGPHLAMQFHLEIDAEKAARWALDTGARWSDVQHLPSVQRPAALREGVERHLRAHQALASVVYGHWIASAR
jgi:GMP synthase-like glutamine amidotransferase